jgi:hypothetical protein
MARTRYLKPEFFSNEQLADLEPLARLLFAGLWCYADREGRLEDRPRRIQVEILPYDSDANIDEMLTQLANANFIIRYEVQSVRYLAISNFVKHQRPHPNEPASGLPGPNDKSAKPDKSRSKRARKKRDNVISPSDNIETASGDVTASCALTLKSYSYSYSDTHTRARAQDRKTGVCVPGSKFSLKECRSYAETLPDIRSPAALAKSMWRSGADDEAIAGFVECGGRRETPEERYARIGRLSAERTRARESTRNTRRDN